MMLAKTRPALLSSSVARTNLSDEIPEFRHVFNALDAHGELWTGLSQLRATADSRSTREARAERYALQRKAAMERSNLILNNARHDLAARRDRLREAAINKSGLNAVYPQAQEVREVLRGLSQKERDEAINSAVDRGEAWVVASVVNQPDLLTGKTSLSKAVLVDLFIKRADPTLQTELDAIGEAFEHLSLAEQSFSNAAEEMRDVEAESRAAADAKAVAEAEAVFAKAMGSSAPELDA